MIFFSAPRRVKSKQIQFQHRGFFSKEKNRSREQLLRSLNIRVSRVLLRRPRKRYELIKGNFEVDSAAINTMLFA